MKLYKKGDFVYYTFKTAVKGLYVTGVVAKIYNGGRSCAITWDVIWGKGSPKNFWTVGERLIRINSIIYLKLRHRL